MMQPLSNYNTDPALSGSDSFGCRLEESGELNSVREYVNEEYEIKQVSVNERGIKIADDVARMLSFNLGTSWVAVADKVGFSEGEIQKLQSLYIPKEKWVIKFNDLLVSSSNNTYYLECFDPKIIEAITLFIPRALEKVNLDEFFNAVEKINPYLSMCARKIQNESIPKKQGILGRKPDLNSKFSSYIFLQWVKMPGRVTIWGDIIPNTEILPHQQTAYDWAFLNGDKIVVLWFDSYKLTDEEIKQYYNFEKKIKSVVDNLLVLDIRDVNWSDVSLQYYGKSSSEPPLSSMTPRQVLDNHEFTSLGDRVDFLRERLLYEGSFAIESALRKQNKHLEMINFLPSRGVYFDLDFVPRKFDSSEVHHKPICIDDSLRSVSGYTIDHDGTVHFGGHFSNSLIAVNQDHLDLLGEYLAISLYDYSLPYYSGLSKTLNVFRDRVGGTRNFKMSGSLQLYRGDFLPEWGGVHGGTWRAKGQAEVNQQKNLPLNFRGARKMN